MKKNLPRNSIQIANSLIGFLIFTIYLFIFIHFRPPGTSNYFCSVLENLENRLLWNRWS